MTPTIQPLSRHTLRRVRARAQGSTLIVVLFLGAVLLLVASALFQTLSPSYRTTFESASWQDSLLAAEGGADLALTSIQASAPDATANPWTGWTNPSGNRSGPWTYNALAADSLALTHAGEGNTKATLAQLTVDVYTRESNVDTDPDGAPWYRIHSVGRADVPGSKLANPDRRDAQLRRMRFVTDASHPNRGVTRGVEVIARPVYTYKNAIWTVGDMALGSSNNWLVDSFNSGLGKYGATDRMDAIPGCAIRVRIHVALPGVNVHGEQRQSGLGVAFAGVC